MARKRQIFLSYRHTDHDLARVVERELHRYGFRIWADWTSRLSLRRRWATRRDDSSEAGLDTWLRSGALRSHFLIALIDQDSFLSNFFIHEGDQGQPFVQLLARGEQRPGKIYRDASIIYYLSHLRRLWQNEYYRWFMKFRIGKDRLENWQQWELRVAQAMGTRTLIAVLGKKGDAAGTIQALIARGIRTSGIDPLNFQGISFDNICMLRRENVIPDLSNNVIPYLRKIAEQGPTRRSRTSRLRYKAAKALSPFAVATLPFVGVVVLLIFLLLDVAILLLNGFKSLMSGRKPS